MNTTVSTESRSREALPQAKLPKFEPNSTSIHKDISPIPSLSLENTVVPKLQQHKGDLSLFLLRAPQFDANASPSEQAGLYNYGEQGLRCMICSVEAKSSESPEEELVLSREKTIHDHMLKFNPMLREQIYGRYGILTETLHKLGLEEVKAESVAYVDPHRGLPYDLRTMDDTIIEVSPCVGYEVLAVKVWTGSPPRIHIEKHKEILLEKLTPESSLEEKIAAISYLQGNEKQQLELVRRIEPFYLTNSSECKARHGQFSPRIVEEFFTGPAQLRAYTMGMIAWPKKTAKDGMGRVCYTEAYAKAVEEFHDAAKNDALKLVLEREHPFLAKETSSWALAKHNMGTAIPEQAAWVAKKVAQNAEEGSAVVQTKVDAVINDTRNRLRGKIASTIHETISDAARSVISNAWKHMGPRIW